MPNQESDMIAIPRSIALLASLDLIIGLPRAFAGYPGTTYEEAMR
ncbi:hypothetical protein ALO46_100769 [Pseudomonas syringae pv. solidagae]|uniref:Uncharacterized protein n=1 Tax=Pseudomonas syringae pv. solidagae TaxID=264458 RepID=A0A0N8SSX5_PSESX|nr:hypothetical protein ALO46_100769 [Pseudomonas syringae pv. solidagae]RMR51319.1 hypothetical protein ALP85_02253 [Pseudomonas syringae pv. syringae]RMT36312.1 hypothetical protein ALP49_100790 [Pseudomonas syringae pv. solidagae]RMT50971.1 hypothetical protein ALP48_100728 [Pseudomonas syringae pv. solidagae]